MIFQLALDDAADTLSQSIPDSYIKYQIFKPHQATAPTQKFGLCTAFFGVEPLSQAYELFKVTSIQPPLTL